MATKRAKMVQVPATLDQVIASGWRSRPLEDPAQAQPEQPSSLTRRILGDGGISLLKGAVGVPEAAVGLADLVSGGRVGQALEQGVDIGGVNIGFRPKMAKEALDQMLTPEQQKANQEVQQAQGFLDTTIAALQNPSTILHASAESLPVMGGGAVIGRALMAGTMRAAPGLAARIGAAEAAPLVASPGAQTAAKYAPVLAGAAGEGVTTMGSQAESIRQETPDGLLTGQQSALAAGSGFITGGLSVLGGAVAAKLGITDIDTLLQGKHSPEVTKGFTRRVLEGAVSEGLLEELPQSVQEQVAQNLALGKPLGEGVSQAAVLGMFSGGLMGGGSNIPKSLGSAIRQEKAPPTGPVAKAVNAGLEDTAQQADAIEATAAAAAVPQPVPVQPVPPVAQPMPGAEVAQAAPAEAVPDANAGAFEQRQADKPPEPAAEPLPGEKVLKSMDTAMRAKARAGEGAEIVPVAGGVVVRKVDADTGELVPAAAPAAAPELPGVEAAPPAPPAAPPAAALPDDVLNAQGKPFTNRGAAANKMRALGKDYTIAAVDGGFAVRKLASVAAPVDQAAHAAATSPNNPLPEPTQAQKEAGNYAKGHHKLAGLDLSIENPAGSVRRGTDKNGKAWENTLQHHYGYIKGTIGNDKDHVDAFVKPGTPDEWNGTAFVVDQVHPETGKFDEHKALLGFDTEQEAREAYAANYAKGWKGLKSISAMPAAEFKAWVMDGPKTAPLAQETAIEGQADRPSDDGVAAPAGPVDAPAPQASAPSIPEPGPSTPDASTSQEVTSKVEPPAAPADKGGQWDATLPKDRVPVLLRAGWMDKSPGTQAMMAKPWASLTPSQKARITNAIGTPAAPVPDASPTRAPRVPDATATTAALSTAQVGRAFDYMVQHGRDTLTSVLYNWREAELSPDGEKIVMHPGRDGRFSKGKEGGKVGGSKGEFIAWLRSEAPFDAKEFGSSATDPEWRGEIERLRGLVADALASAPAPAAPKRSKAAQNAADARRAQLDAYFTPGNIVKSYGGHDEVLSLKHSDDGGFSVHVHAVTKSQGSGQWVRLGKPQDARWHSTFPEARELKAGPVAGPLMHMAGDLVSYTEGRADGKPFPNAPDRGVDPGPAKAERARLLDAFDAAPVGSTLEYQGRTFEKVTGSTWREPGTSGTALASSFFVDHGVKGTKSLPTTAPAPKTDKAEMRPYRRADGGIGYEAVPIVEAAAPAPQPDAKAPTLLEARNTLIDLRTQAEAQGQVADDRLLERIRRQEKLVRAMEVEQASDGQNDELDAEMRSYEAKATPPTPAPAPAPAVQPSANTIFTEDAAAKAREVLRRKLGNLNTGIDPEILQAGITLAGYHIEKGARTFAAYVQAMVSDLGDDIKPYLQSWYMAVRSDPRAAEFKASMDKASAIEDLTPAEIDAMAQQQTDSGTPPAADPAQNDATKEKPDDPAASGPAPTVDQPMVEGPAPNDARRGAKPPRQRVGRRDDPSVRGQGGLFEGAADEGAPLGNSGEPDRVPAGADGDLAGRLSGVPTRDYRPAPGALKREGSWFATAARNIDLIELARRIESEGRQATPEEQAQLAKYVGFGASEIRNNLFPVPSPWQKQQDPKRLIWPDLVREARWKPLAERMAALPEDWQRSVLQSTQYAHYTSEGVIRSVWSGLQRLGFTGGKMLEPGMGIGSFNMLMPESVHKTSRYTGVEFDGPTALIARLLSPDQNMLHEDFIKRKFPRDFFDLAIGNPPFSQTKVLADPDYEKHGFMLHDFFFAKSLDRVRPGGLLVFVTSKGTMDKQTDKARKYLGDRADLLGAIRLPSTAFEDNAGTSVVTDVLFLRKRAEGEAPAGPAWQGVQTVDTKDGPVVVNEYFAANPDMVLGEQRISGNVDDFGRRINSNGMVGAKYTVVSYDSTAEQLDERFAKAIERLPENVYSALRMDAKQLKKETAKVDFDPAVKREGVVYLGKDGTLMRVQNGLGVGLGDHVKLSPKDEAWLKGYVGVRDLVQAARMAQVQDGDWEKALKALNKAYDAFRKEHGPVNDFRTQTRKSTDEDGNEVSTEIRIFKNRRLFREDYDSAVMTQLEVINEAGEIIKAPFLLGRTIGKPVVSEVKTVGDALAVSLDETGRLDLDDIARRMSITRDDAIEALGNQVFKAPNGQWQLADEYLSGDVVTKLEEAEIAARLDESLKRNVEALKAVQPEKLGPSQISVKAGASWVPVEYVNEFAKEIGAGRVTFDAKTESWQVQGGNERSGRRAGLEYGTADRSPSELLESVLNSQSITIKKTTADKKTVTDPEATTAANEMARKIKDKFKGWIWTDADRATHLVEAYNKRFNNIAPRRFDGSHMTLPGVSLRFSLHPHQKRAIWRQVQTGNTYLAHAVGAGKTIEMIAGGMEQKRLGLINKPIYAVPNHMLEQFANEFMELYPLANIMVADDENFSAERRKAFVAAATLNAPDAIIITHSAFERIGIKEETVAPIRDEILLDLQAELDDAKADRVRRSQLQQQIEAVEQRFDSIAGVGKKDSTIKFEDIGADFVYVDEAHAYRKLDFTTNQKIKGIDPNGSRRALDMYVKTRHLEKQRPGRAMVFASGTPVTNTMGELYTIMRFFAPDELARGGISTFDAWARQFGEAVPALEANAAGRYEVVERFAKFDNVPELMSRVRQFMDVLTSEHLGALVKRPDIEGGKPDLITVEPAEALKRYMKTELLPRLEKSRKWKPNKDQPFNPDPVIAITSDGRFAALDPRFFGEQIDEDKTPTKMTRMADEVAKVYHASAVNVYFADKDKTKPEPIKGSTQIVFYNLGFGQQSTKNRGFDARAALNRRLMAQGVKREHILWFDDADTDSKKEAMFKAMRSGQARILIGSAKKMGTGVNVQKRLLALHYFDPPWYPSDVEQPHGRIIRQGNQNQLATIKWYATKGTYDSTMWQMVGRKQRFIDQAFSGDKSLRSMEDMSEASMFEQAAAVASGDPRALQLAGLRQDVERLERLQAAHHSEQVAVRSGLRGAEWNIESYQKRIQTYGEAFKAIGAGYYSFSKATVDGRTFDKVGEFGQALKDAFNKQAADSVMNPETKTRELATLPPGITIRMEADEGKDKKPTGLHELVLRAGAMDITLAGATPSYGEKVDAVGLGRRVVNAINNIESELNRAKASLAAEETDATRLRKKLGAPFEYTQELAEKIGELKRLEEELRAEGEADAKAAAAAANPVVIDENGAAEGDLPADDEAMLSRTMGPQSKALEAFSQLDDLFALPRSDKADVAGIAADIDPQIKVTPHLAEGLDRYAITMPDGSTASIFVREPSPWGPHTYGNTYDDQNQLIGTTNERPGANADRVPEGTGDVWVDVSKLKTGQGGNKVYAIAGALAHNTGRIFIGDPNGLTDVAMRRRPEQMLSLALRYGTTDFLAPHPQQVHGSPKAGVPALKWSYGDDMGNIRALIDLNLKVLENAGLDDNTIRFDTATGDYLDSAGQVLGRTGIEALSKGTPLGRGVQAGSRTIARGALLRALLREGGRAGPDGRGRNGLLASIETYRADAPEATDRLFSRGGSGQGLDLASARRLADGLAAGGLTRINVVRSVGELPEQPKLWIAAKAPDGRVRGAYLKGTDQVWMFADQIRTPDEFVFVALHEAFHRGLHKVIPDSAPLLTQMYRSNKALRAAADEQKRLHKIGQLEAIEEALADMAGAGTARDLSGWDKLLNLVREWLGKLAKAAGIQMTWTDDMVADFVAGIRAEGLKGGVHVDQGAATLSRTGPKYADIVHNPYDSASDRLVDDLMSHFEPLRDLVDGWRPRVASVRAGDLMPETLDALEEELDRDIDDNDTLRMEIIKPSKLDAHGKHVTRVSVVEPAPAGRAAVQAQAKAMGLPATGTTAQIQRLVDIAQADPNSWTREDFDLIAPHLSIHQDLRTGSDNRVDSIMANGLNKGMVDSLGRMVAGQWTWAGKLDGVDTYAFITGALKFQSKDSAWLAPGNKPLFHFRPEPGQSPFEAVTQTTSGGAMLSRSFKGMLNDAKEINLPAQYKVGDFFNADGKVHWWHKTVGTMHNLAERSPLFKRVYDSVQSFVGDVSYYAAESANLAPKLLPKLENWKDIAKSPIKPEDAKAIAAPIFEGTLVWMRDTQGQPVRVSQATAETEGMTTDEKARAMLLKGKLDERVYKMWQGMPEEQFDMAVNTRFEREMLKPGLVWTEAELRARFNLSTEQIGLYREFRKATDKSLTNLAISDMLRYGGDDVAPLRARALSMADAQDVGTMLRDYLWRLADADPERRDVLNDTGRRIKEKADHIADVMARGYAPLSRHGQFTLDVVDADGERVYFGLFESAAERTRMARQMKAQFPAATITTGTTSQEAYKLFAGVGPETLELFGEFLGLESQGSDDASKAFQQYIKLTKSTRSAMRRLIERKGIAGFSEDAGRVLAGFVYSNARQTASNLHMGEMSQAAAEIPKGQGQLQDAAVKLVDYVKNPQEEAQTLRGWLFAQYIGGSVASFLVNMTQPVTTTLPYLSQFGGAAKAAQRIATAARLASKDSTGNADLDKALRHAEEEGIVSPQEVHQLQAQAMGRGSLRVGDGTTVGNLTAKGLNKLALLGFAWGKLFGMAEQVNRRITFIAAYNTALAEGMADAAGFAAKAVTETQFTYNKGNKPRWARGAVGSVAFTFKQYSISYLELLNRMWNAGEEGSPERRAGRKAVLLALAVLMLAGGADGLPFMQDAEDIIDGLLQRLGFNFSTKQRRREFLVRALGDGGAEFVSKGLSGLPGAPIDVSGRMGMGNLIPGTGLLTKKTDYSKDVAEFAGPAADLASRGLKAAGQLVDGDVKAAATTILPTAGQNIAKAYDMAKTGMYRDDKGRKVLDVDGYDTVAKALGFQPHDVAKVQDSTSMVQRMIAQTKIREAEIASAWAQGIFEKNPEKIQEARDDLARWNENNPAARISISLPQILKRVRAMNQSKTERIAKTAPKEMRAQVREALAEGSE